MPRRRSPGAVWATTGSPISSMWTPGACGSGSLVGHRHRGPLRLANGQNRQVTEAHDLFGDASEEGAANSGEAVRADDDQARGPLLRDAVDLTDDVPFPDDELLLGCELFLQRPFGLRPELPTHFEESGLGVSTSRREPRLEDVEEADRTSEGDCEAAGDFERAAGAVAEVGGDEDLPDSAFRPGDGGVGVEGQD